MRCLRCILVFALSCMLVAMLAGVAIVLFMADWLVRSDPVGKADAIVVLAGAPERPLYAADLYLEKYAPKVLVSRPAQHRSQSLLTPFGIELQREEDVNVALLRAKQVPGQAIEVFGSGSVSTAEEMAVLKRRYQGQTVQLLIVTSPLHTRRARAIARQAFEGTAIEPIVVATPYEQLPQRWWTNQYTARDVTLEVIKTLFWLLGGRFGTT